MTLFSVPIQRFMASGSLARAMRANGMVDGTSVKRDMYSPRRLSFWVWAYHISEEGGSGFVM